ncbi:hypothetical protein OJ997_04350 [Solirubrobacter phytolaccae]|uniref:Uncharacterized protein n=1 Tax=Solirubrobacter phytolaccae TaxID=1404360 RepID=A0A9X3NB94_9ACTN|nr:hypothetical protein [Solirubrobacter phytolaccae]MDA0179517.1 hypothetical protein [Solirubrobacter phytolaccae]
MTSLYGGYLTFGEDKMDDAFRGWSAWTATADPRVTTTAAFTRPPGHGPRSLALHCAFPGGSDEGARAIAALRDLGPDADTVQLLPARDIARVFDEPRGAAPSWSQGLMLAAFDPDCAERLLQLLGAHGSMPFIKVQVRHLGGAAANDIEGGSPAPGRGCPFILGAIGIDVPSFNHAYPAAFDELRAALDRWTSPELTANFACGGTAGYAPGVEARLREIEQRLTDGVSPA